MGTVESEHAKNDDYCEQRGKTAYHADCLECLGLLLEPSALLPSLRRLNSATAGTSRRIVRDGLLTYVAVDNLARNFRHDASVSGR
jgi:hypothetical protein